MDRIGITGGRIGRRHQSHRGKFEIHKEGHVIFIGKESEGRPVLLLNSGNIGHNNVRSLISLISSDYILSLPIEVHLIHCFVLLF